LWRKISKTGDFFSRDVENDFVVLLGTSNRKGSCGESRNEFFEVIKAKFYVCIGFETRAPFG